METAVKVIVAILVVAGLTVWVTTYAFSGSHERVEESELVAAVGETQSPNSFTAEGVLMRYQSADIPLYYLLYETPNHRFLRKELRFVEERGCSAQAGDLPCVLRSDPNTPPVSVGSYIAVEGIEDAQRIVVEKLRVIPETSDTFEYIPVREGNTYERSDVSITVTSISTEGSCKAFSGCFDDGIPRASFTFNVYGREGEKTFVPGMFVDVPDGILLLLSADEAEGGAVFILAHKRYT